MTSTTVPPPGPTPAPASAPTPAQGPMRWFGTLSTSVKLFLFMLLFLAPLGIIAILASIESARANQANRIAASRASAAEGARAVDAVVAGNLVLLRAAATALEGGGGRGCEMALAAIRAADPDGAGLAIYSKNGRLICAIGATPPFVNDRDGITLAADGGSAVVAARGRQGRLIGVTRISRSDLVAATRTMPGMPQTGLAIREDDATMQLRQPPPAGDGELTRASAPLAGDVARIEVIMPGARMTAIETLSILLPLLMLLSAAVVAFLVTDRLMLRPLKRLQDAVLAYRAGDHSLVIPHITTPAREIRALAAAFRATSGTIVRHEHELEEGLARQTKLTREVHHRVKNNLQVVASLINLHARGAPGQGVAEAYAAIQRRVDALAVVHRNHYAELEENRGVALRPLIGELAANLRAGAPVEAAAIPITLDLAPLYATQDVAVPVAFLVTELVESAMLRAPTAPVRIALEPAAPGRATLSIVSAALSEPGTGRVGERVERVLQGLSRQLRTTLDRDPARGRVAIEIAVVD